MRSCALVALFWSQFLEKQWRIQPFWGIRFQRYRYPFYSSAVFGCELSSLQSCLPLTHFLSSSGQVAAGDSAGRHTFPLPWPLACAFVSQAVSENACQKHSSTPIKLVFCESAAGSPFPRACAFEILYKHLNCYIFKTPQKILYKHLSSYFFKRPQKRLTRIVQWCLQGRFNELLTLGYCLPCGQNFSSLVMSETTPSIYSTSFT